MCNMPTYRSVSCECCWCLSGHFHIHRVAIDKEVFAFDLGQSHHKHSLMIIKFVLVVIIIMDKNIININLLAA